MKEASGELSMTAIAVVAIAAIGIVFTTLVWPQMKAGIDRNTKCSAAFNCTCPPDGGMCDCLYAPGAEGSTGTGTGTHSDTDVTPIMCPPTKVNNN